MNYRVMIQRGVLYACIMFLGMVVLGLYSISGLPKPWARTTAVAYEKSARNTLEGIVRNLRREPAIDLKAVSASQLDQLLREVVGEKERELAGLGALRVVETRYDVGRILIVSSELDSNGMVWAITDCGAVVRCDPTANDIQKGLSSN